MGARHVTELEIGWIDECVRVEPLLGAGLVDMGIDAGHGIHAQVRNDAACVVEQRLERDRIAAIPSRESAH